MKSFACTFAFLSSAAALALPPVTNGTDGTSIPPMTNGTNNTAPSFNSTLPPMPVLLARGGNETNSTTNFTALTHPENKREATFAPFINLTHAFQPEPEPVDWKALTHPAIAEDFAVPFPNATNGTNMTELLDRRAPVPLTWAPPNGTNSTNSTDWLPRRAPVPLTFAAPNGTNSTNSTNWHPVNARRAVLDLADAQADPVKTLQSLVQSGAINVEDLPAPIQEQLQSLNNLRASDATALLQDLARTNAIDVQSLPAELQSQLQSITGLANLS